MTLDDIGWTIAIGIISMPLWFPVLMLVLEWIAGTLDR